jgi:hypothetical protein
MTPGYEAAGAGPRGRAAIDAQRVTSDATTLSPPSVRYTSRALPFTPANAGPAESPSSPQAARPAKATRARVKTMWRLRVIDRFVKRFLWKTRADECPAPVGP